ncbi:MAG: Dihydrodipicolinate synthase [Gemmatimonadetes bacterium]|nr:Dihydrodipicolinate synthase [Gemmatimonadota bacterium]
MTTKLTGCGTAIVTPFQKDGTVDEGALRAFVDWQVEEGIHFLVPCGSTGEAATMTLAEHRRVVEITVEQVKGRVPVCAGAGSNDTQKAIDLSREMKELGATHLLHVSPMYNKPPQRGIVAHFKAIAEQAGLPIVVYNVPGRTGSNIEAKTTLELAKVDGIAAVKEASGSLAQITDIIRDAPKSFSVLSGDDEITLAMLALGGDGVISVISNATPKKMAALCDAAREGKWDRARELHFELLAWMRAAFVESNPLPVKAAMHMLGKMQNRLRLPLVPLLESNEQAVREALSAAGAL